MCSICLISILSGVYSQMASQTLVHFKVYAPPGFLKYKPQVFYRQGLIMNITTRFELQGLDVDQFGEILYDCLWFIFVEWLELRLCMCMCMHACIWLYVPTSCFNKFVLINFYCEVS